MQVRPGDDVLFGTFAGAPVEIEDEVFAVVLESDILLILGRSE
jgi:co-chaperonin GroES (HSP10)